MGKKNSKTFEDIKDKRKEEVYLKLIQFIKVFGYQNQRPF